MKKDYELNKFFLEKLSFMEKNNNGSLSYLFLSKILNDLFASSFFVDEEAPFTSFFTFYSKI